MSAIQFKRYSKPAFLKSIGRELLTSFFDKFTDDLQAAKLTLPDATLPDADYFQALAQVLLSPEGLPDRLNDVLYAIDEMSGPAGAERLEQALADSGCEINLRAESTGAEIALQIWLACPDLLAKKHNEQRLLRLTSFEHFGTNIPSAEKLPFKAPANIELELLSKELDEWFVKHNRGDCTTRIDVHNIRGKWWFVVRHGDRFQRTPTVDKRKTEIIHFRPEKDDVVVFNEQLDELSINAGTKGEKTLYREKFGRYLRGNDRYFSETKAYTLEPLREQGEDALSVDDIPGIEKVVLLSYKVAWNNGHNESITREATDIFAAAENRSAEPIPDTGDLVSATFEVTFTDCPTPRKVEIRPKNVLKLARNCDADMVNLWLTKRGFRILASPGSSATPPNVSSLAHN